MIPGYEDFAALVSERFAVAGPAGEVVLELQSATRHRNYGSGPVRGFNLMFLGPREAPLPQATYRFAHPRCTTDIFIVAVGLDDHGYRYEAVFNA